MTKLIDWHLRKVRSSSSLPDIPEVRRFMRLSFWNGFFFGALHHKVELARLDALLAIATLSILEQLRKTDLGQD